VSTPNIVILDAAPALTDLDISGLSALGVVTAYESTQPEQLAERMLNADIVITNKCRLDDALFAACPGLKGISVLATGLDNIAVDAASARGIGVRNVAGYSTPSTAQLAVGLLLAAAHNIVGNAVHVAHGGWQARGVWSYTLRPMLEIAGSNIGIIGYGNIGKAIATQMPGRPPPEPTSNIDFASCKCGTKERLSRMCKPIIRSGSRTAVRL
jgi:glycerate dehydrogenase